MPHKVFFCLPSGRAAIEYCCTSKDGRGGCNGRDYHRAEAVAFYGDAVEASVLWSRAADDALYPAQCACGYQFAPGDHKSRGMRRVFVRQDTGEEVILGQAPIGACWDADWYREDVKSPRTGPDGRYLIVKTPGGDWAIDSRASNCTRKDDNTHRCWVRHGKPEDGTLNVDKNGDTCAAGAGSIMCGSYHGFLRNGFLTDHC